MLSSEVPSHDKIIRTLLDDMDRLSEDEHAALSDTMELTTSRRPLDEIAVDIGVLTRDEQDDLVRECKIRRLDALRHRLAGARIGSFQIIEEIGHGGMGVVFRARQESPMFTRDVALKVQLASGDEVAERGDEFIGEVKALAELSHPSLVSIFDSGIDGAVYWFAMELVDGRSLAEVPEAQEMPIERRVEIVRDIARALEYLHRRGVVHRDVKPANIMIDGDGRARLLDFGLAQFSADPRKRAIQAGTPLYVAPEVILPTGAFGPIGPATDVFALGVVLFELVVGQPPHSPNDGIEALFERVLTGDPVLPRRRDRGLGALERITRRALSRRSSDRFPNGGEFADALDRFLRKRRQRARRLISLLLVFIALAAGVIAKEMLDRRSEEHERELATRVAPLIERARTVSTELPDSLPELASSSISETTELDELIARTRIGDEEAEARLDARVREIWSERIERAAALATAAGERASRALARSFSPDDIHELLERTQDVARSRAPVRESFERIVAALRSFERLEDVAETRAVEAEARRRLDVARMAAENARAPALAARRELDEAADLRWPDELRSRLDAVERTVAAAETAISAERYDDARVGFEEARKFAAELLQSARTAFWTDLDQLHATLLERRQALEKAETSLSVELLAADGPALHDALGRAEVSWRAQRASISRESLDLFDRAFLDLRTRSELEMDAAMSARVRAEEAAEVGPILAELRDEMIAAREAHRRGEAAHARRAYREATTQFAAAATGYSAVRETTLRRTRSMVWIDGGTVRGRSVPGFWIDRTEVSVARFAAVLGHRGPGTRSEWPLDWERQRAADRSLPVTGVSLATASAHARARAAALPTREEWELAARRGSDGRLRRFPWGDEFEPHRANGSGVDDGFAGLAPVESLFDGASASGVLHMSGNAAEWTIDAEDSRRAWILGGSWETGEPAWLACDEGIAVSLEHDTVTAEAWQRLVGFRCVVRPLEENAR
jgi:serine/threonine protein kinase/formylglycine-generating enzyme required for sulfatase activity